MNYVNLLLKQTVIEKDHNVQVNLIFGGILGIWDSVSTSAILVQ